MLSITSDMENYLGIIKMIAEQFGSHCEVVLHDLTGDYEHTIVAIENAHVTGRSIGGCGSNLGLQVLSGNESASGTHCYYTRLPNGHMLKSSTCYLKNKAGEVIGAICVNLDVTDILQIPEILNDYGLTMQQKPQNEQVHEVFAENVTELLESLINECQSMVGKDPQYMTKQEKISAIAFLDSRGAFLITKAGDRISKYLEISKNTMYAYLDIARTEKREKASNG